MRPVAIGGLPGGSIRRISRQAGFTLMETLVTLVIVTLLSTLIFQVTGHFALVYDRLLGSGQEAALRQRSAYWFRQSLAAATPSVRARELACEGNADVIRATTLASLTGLAGMPVRITWQLERDRQEERLVYAEADGRRWAVLTGLRPGTARFGYLDVEGGRHDHWPVKTLSGDQPELALVHFHAEAEEPVDWYVAVTNQTLGWLVEE